MSTGSNKISTCLFFESCAEAAANFYVSVFPNSSIDVVTRVPSNGQGPSWLKPGSVLLVAFTLNGKPFTALNSRPAEMTMSEAISFQIDCDDQEEVDHYWSKLTDGGDESKQRCCWLQDQFGVSWQVVPKIIPEMMGSGDADKIAKCMKVVSDFKKPVVQDIIDAVNDNK